MRYLLNVLLLCSLAGAAPTHGSPVVAGEGNGDEKISVQLRVRGAWTENGVHEASTTVGSGGADLGPGETARSYVTVGGFSSDGRADPSSLCMKSTGRVGIDEDTDQTVRELTSEAPHVWWAEIREMPSEVGTAAFEITWQHLFSETSGAAVKIAGDTRRITMREGESHVLDFVAVDPSVDARCFRNVVIDVKAEVVEDPAIAGELLRYDLWLQHHTATDDVITRRFQAVGRQGESLDFRFVPLRFPVPGAVLDDGSRVDSILEVIGSLQGRARPDGSIDVRLSAMRWVDAEKAGTARRGGNGDGGNKTFSMVPGETVSMKLPSPSGRSGIARGFHASTTANDDDLDPAVMWVDNAEFYAGHRAELILTVAREQ